MAWDLCLSGNAILKAGVNANADIISGATDIETFSNVVDISTWSPGTYIFYVYGWDSTPIYNNSGQAFAVLKIINNMAPAVENVLAFGHIEILEL